MPNYYSYYPAEHSAFSFGDTFITILFWVLIIYLVVNIVRWLKMTSLHGHDWDWRSRRMERKYKNYEDSFERTGNYMKDNTALDILKERYAKGEISKMQYEDMKRDLMM